MCLTSLLQKNLSPNYTKIEHLTDLTSDHTPIVLNISTNIFLIEPPFKIYNRKTTDWDVYREIINSDLKLITKITTGECIEKEIEHLNITIHKAATVATPKRKGKGIPFQYNSYPQYIKDKVKERRRLRKIWHSTGYPSDKTQFNKYSAELKNLIDTFENDNMQNFLSNLSPKLDTNYSLWKVTKNLKRPKIHTPPVNNNKGGWARSDLEKAITFAEHLSTVFQPLVNTEHQENPKIKEFLESPTQLCLPLKSTGPKEVIREIKNLQDGKAPGYDNIDATLLKHLPFKGIMKLVNMFNACLRLQIFPGQWRVAQVVMVPKPGKPPQLTASYRPISLLPVIGKLFERILLNRIKGHLDSALPNHQFGFREKHGTVEQVHRLVNNISGSLEKKLYCSAVFLDISQAFDKVWHAGLLYKLKQALPHCFFHILQSYLDKRCFQVKQNNELSGLYEIKSGVPQGSILGPIL